VELGGGDHMIYNELRKILCVALSLLLITVWSPVYGYQEQQEGGGNPNMESAPQSPEQLQALVAPIALYPDALVAQILSAATFPDQVAQAGEWQQQHKDLTGEKLAEEVNKQQWDPSVKAITQFASVLENMNKNMAWTSELGEAYHNQPKDVMAAVQVLRKQAKAAGNLKTTSQMTVVEQSPDVIVIQPANPQVVYVPTYNPTVIYGTPYVVPGYTAGEVAAAGVIAFGAGIAIGAAMSSHYSWGWSAWGVGWHGGTVVYGRAPYYGNAAWHGGYGAYGYHGYGTTYHGAYGSAASYHGAYGNAGAYSGANRAGGYSSGGAYRTAYGGQSRQTSTNAAGGVHTSGSGYSNVTGQGYHYGASQTAAGGTAYHGTTSSGQRVAGGTTASGQKWGGSTNAMSHDSGWSSRAASSRGASSMHASGGGRRR
jgi:Protein of unknown function (DUF3300)